MSKLKNPIVYFILVSLILVLSQSQSISKTFEKALPGYVYSFPKDHASHPDYKTEWWYYTGHLESEDKKKFGFELTFFRVGLDTEPTKTKNAWSMDNIYLAHFAISDIDKKEFSYSQKLNRRGLNLASARQDIPYVTNERWKMLFVDDRIILTADQKKYSMDLVLKSKKKPVIHGIDGVSQKASGLGRASHYYSLTRLEANGILFVDGKPHKVKGNAWMDHEFGSNQLTDNQVGWDWFSIQLDNNREIMLYVMRRKDGSIDKYSSGTIVGKDGNSKHLSKEDFIIKSSRIWKSNKTNGRYPLEWEVKIPRENIELKLSPLLDDQELVTGKTTGVSYWEGACSVSGKDSDKTVKGSAYVEMTGYAEVFKKRI